MAYLRPLNSSESNLYVIRFNTPDVTPTNVAGITASNYYRTVPSSYYANPSSDLLPEGFAFMIGDGSSASYSNYKINFGTMKNPYTDPPAVSVNIVSSSNATSNALDVDSYNIVIESVDKNGFTFSVRSSTDSTGSENTRLLPFTSATSALLPIRFSIFVVGSVISGPTFAISNRGWNVPESSVNKLYTYQSVGIGTGKVDGTFNLKGTMVTPANKITINSTSFSSNAASASSELSTSLLTYTLNIITVDNSTVSGVNTITLPAGNNGQILRINITNIAMLDTGKSVRIATFEGNVVLISNTVNKRMTELYYDSDSVGWRVMYQA